MLCIENAANSESPGKGRRAWGQTVWAGQQSRGAACFIFNTVVGLVGVWSGEEGMAGSLSQLGGDFAALSAKLVGTK